MSKVTKKSLEDVEAGDWVYEISDYGNSAGERKVERTTKTQIHLSPWTKYNRQGSAVGGSSYGAPSISVDPVYAKMAARSRVRTSLRNYGRVLAGRDNVDAFVVQNLRVLANEVEAYLNEYGEDE